MLYDKRALYDCIENKLNEFGMDNNFPADIFSIIKKENIALEYHPFESDSIGAVLCKDTFSGILVNKNTPRCNQRFDIAHELIHYWFHPNHTSFSFTNLESRDKEKEWQANEGAAELLLPYKDFIPEFIKAAKYAEENYEPPESIYDNLSKYYKVNPIVVDYRIRNLENEILQYHSGVPIDEISITKSNVRIKKDKPPVVYISFLNRIHNKNLR